MSHAHGSVCGVRKESPAAWAAVCKASSVFLDGVGSAYERPRQALVNLCRAESGCPKPAASLLNGPAWPTTRLCHEPMMAVLESCEALGTSEAKGARLGILRAQVGKSF